MAAKDLYDKDLYKILGVSKTDDAITVKKAYRKLAKDLRPDKTKGDKKLEEKFKEVSEAYEVLSDPKKRAEYEGMRDMMSSRGRGKRSGNSNFGFQPGPRPQGNYRSQYDADADYDEFIKGEDYNDIFENFFGNKASSRQSSRGSDLQTEVTISFRDSVLGKEISIRLENESIKVRIPSGINDGAKVKVKGRGADGTAGPGDLFIIIHIALHPIFTKKENDLLMTLPVTFTEIVLGANISIPTFSGEEVTIRVPAGTKNGKILRIPRLGIKKQNISGDLLVTLDIQVPQKLNAKAKQLLEEFTLANSEYSPRDGLKEQVGL